MPIGGLYGLDAARAYHEQRPLTAATDRELTGLLAEAEAAIAECEQHIAQQRAVIEKLSKDGLDTAEAKYLLVAFLESRGLHEGHRDQLRCKLDVQS